MLIYIMARINSLEQVSLYSITCTIIIIIYVMAMIIITIIILIYVMARRQCG